MIIKFKVPLIAKNSAIYIVFNILQRAINFFLLPLYTIYLTPEDYGITNVLTSAATLLTFLLTFSVQAASSRFHYKYIRNEDIVKNIWGSNLLFIMINSLFWSILAIIGYNYSLRYLIGDEIPFYPYVLICIFNCCFSPIFLYFQSYLQTKQNARYYTINNFLHFFCLLSLTIFVVVVVQMKALGVILANTITNGIFAIYAICAMRRYVNYRFSFTILKKSLLYSVPLLPHTLSGWLNSMLDRIFINRIINLTNVGLYSIAYQFGLIISMIGMGINQAYTPFFFKNHTSDEGKHKISLIADFSIVIVCFVGLILALFSQEILYFMTDTKFHNVWPVIIILVAANLFDCIYKNCVVVLFLDKTRQLSIISIFCSLATCMLNYFLISSIGYKGAAITYLIVQFLVSIIVCIYSHKIRPDIKFNSYLHYKEIIIMMSIIYATTFSLANMQLLQRSLLKIFIFFLVCMLLLLLNYKTIIKFINKNV